MTDVTEVTLRRPSLVRPPLDRTLSTDREAQQASVMSLNAHSL